MTGQKLMWRVLAVVAAGVIAFGVLWPASKNASPDIVISDTDLNRPIAVQIRGAVATPGLYWLAVDARLQNAIDAAGGALPGADLSGVNLARRVDDEEEIEIAYLATPISTAPAAAQASTVSSISGRVNINLATAVQLDALPGIGPALASRIVAYRDAHGLFASVEELSNVSGISPRMVDDLRDLISIGS